jgi:apolipoprotein N-acyltransferase
VALGPLLLLIDQSRASSPRQALVLGWLHGTAAWWVQVPWIAATIHHHGGLPLWAALALLLLLCVYLGGYHAAFAWLGHRLLRRGHLIALLGLPASWVSLEWLRGYLFTGFPWNIAGYALVDVPGALALAPWVGVYGLSFLLVLCNASWALAIVGRRWRPLAGALTVTALLAAGWGVSRGEPKAAAGERHTVSLVQPDTGIVTDPRSVEVVRGYSRLLGLSRCPKPGALVVWPESAAWPYSWQAHEHLRRDLLSIAGPGCGVLFNSTSWEGDDAYNSALLLAPDGSVQRYDKNHLVPFGEYVPLGELLPFVSQLARAAGSYKAADDETLLGWDGERLGLAICFEITLPEQVALQVRRGATVLVTLTNDAWFGNTSAPWQHLAAARLRAAENRRPVLRAAITGISAVIDTRGRVTRRLGVGEAGVIDAEVAGETRLTPYSRAPWAVPATCGVAAILLNLSRIRRNARTNHDRRRGPTTARPREDQARDSPGVPLTAPPSSSS